MVLLTGVVCPGVRLRPWPTCRRPGLVCGVAGMGPEGTPGRRAAAGWAGMAEERGLAEERAPYLTPFPPSGPYLPLKPGWHSGWVAVRGCWGRPVLWVRRGAHCGDRPGGWGEAVVRCDPRGTAKLNLNHYSTARWLGRLPARIPLTLRWYLGTEFDEFATIP